MRPALILRLSTYAVNEKVQVNFSVNRVRRVDFPYSNNVILLLFICISLAEMIDGQ